MLANPIQTRVMSGAADLSGAANDGLPAKPTPNPIIEANIPLALRELDQWVVWKYERSGDRWTKMPYVAGGRTKAKTNDRSTWRSVDVCLNQYKVGNCDGIGFVFAEGDGLAGIDLDHCFDDQGFKPEAQEILSRFEGSAYVERSPGGDGIRMFVLGSMPRSGKGVGALKWIEGYDYLSPRYLTVTGHRLLDSQVEPEESQQALDWFHQTYMSTAEIPLSDGTVPRSFSDANEVEDDWLIGRIRKSNKQGEKFGRLFDKGTFIHPETGEITEDQSSLDMMLVEMLAFWCSRDVDQMDRIFRRSALMRNKWDSPRGHATYGGITISKGIKYNLEHGGSAFKDRQPTAADIDALPDMVSRAIRSVATRCGFEVECFAMMIGLKPNLLCKCLESSAQAQSNGKFVVITPSGDYRVFHRHDFIESLCASIGSPYNSDALSGLLDELADKEGLRQKDREELFKEYASRICHSIVKYILIERQFSNLSVRVDMFATSSSIRLHDGCARITFKHLPLEVGSIDQGVIDDFKEHWPLFDRFIELIAAARFAAARKKAYLWLRAESDFGKGLLEGALDALGLVVSMTTQEIEKVFGGGPVGRQMNEFRRAWILLFNEFKSNKAELKQLEQTISFSPKNLPVCKADIYLKWFTSAEAVESLVSESTGVEDQFANRFSLIQATGSIDTRPMFTASRGHYRDSLTSYIAKRLNELVAQYVARGRRESENDGDKFIIDFHREFGIANKFDRLGVKLKTMADDYIQWIQTEYLSAMEKSQKNSNTLSVTEKSVLGEIVLGKRSSLGEQEVYLKHPTTILDLWLERTFNRAERGKVAVKSSDLRSHLPAFKAHKLKGLSIYSMYVGRLNHRDEFANP